MSEPQRGLGKEFEAGAVRLAEASGCTQHEIAEDAGIGLPTLRRWLDKRRERDLEALHSVPREDLAAELKRLRRENEFCGWNSAISRYIDSSCNPSRRHSALNFINPLQLERQAA